MKINDINIRWRILWLAPHLEVEVIAEMEAALAELVDYAEQLKVSRGKLRRLRKRAEPIIQDAIPRAVMLRHLMRSGKGSAAGYAQMRGALLWGMEQWAMRRELDGVLVRRVEALLPEQPPVGVTA